MTKKPRITVLILTYNRAKLLDRSIKSVMAQSFHDYELVLVDNGSTDNTQEIFQKYDSHPQVRFFKIEENCGFAKGFNFCLDQIQGEWFTTVGDDDEITPDALEKLFNVLDTIDPTLTAISSNGWDTSTDDYSGIGLTKDQYLPLEKIVALCDGDFWGITKTALIKNLRLNTNIPGMEDTFWYQVDAKAHRYYIHEPLITYHTDHEQRETNIQSSDLSKKALLYQTLLEEPFFWEVLRKYNKKQYYDRCIKAMHFLKAKKDYKNYKTYRKMLADDKPGFRHHVYANIIRILHPYFLNKIYQLRPVS